MKRWLSIALGIVLILSLAACSNPDASGSGGESAERSKVPAEDQIAVMLANQDLWLVADEEYSTFYAVTDLDDDGRLELIRSGSLGYWESDDTFFEISEDGQSLEPLAFPFGEEHSHPDLIDQDAFRMYIGPEGRYLIAQDDIFMGPVQGSDYQNFHVLDYLLVKDGEVEAGDIAWCMAIEEDSNGDGLYENHIYYYTGGDTDELLDGEGFVNAPSEQFSGYEEQVCSVGWWTPGLDTEITEDALNTGLNYSWGEFSVEPDPDRFEALVGDPYDTFYAGGAGGAPIYLVGDEVPYFPSFWDVYGTWYLQNAWNDDGITYVGAGLNAGELEILESGLLYADYNNENDPRGPYLFTEMKMVSDSKADDADADDWVIVYESDGGLWQMQLRPDPENEMLYVTWYEWADEAHSTDPVGMNLVYSRIAG